MSGREPFGLLRAMLEDHEMDMIGQGALLRCWAMPKELDILRSAGDSIMACRRDRIPGSGPARFSREKSP